MASTHELELGRVLVNQGLLTQEQVLSLVRTRNEAPSGPELGALTLDRGLVSAAQLTQAQKDVAAGKGKWVVARDQMETNCEISLSATREAVARECLSEALARLDADRAQAVQELRRLAEDFSDTESGNRALEHLRALGETP